MSTNLYPSLEDFKYDLLMSNEHSSWNVGTYLPGLALDGVSSQNGIIIQNGLQKYSTTSVVRTKYLPNPNHHHANSTLSTPAASFSPFCSSKGSLVAPLSGSCRAHQDQPSNTIRPVVICKDSEGKVGLRLSSLRGGVFVVLVYAGSPAAMAGLRFGDQVLEVNDLPVAGHSMSRVHELIRRASPDELRLAVRDRPFERTVTLHKDTNGMVGFTFNKRGRIVSIVRDSSAARNGLLIDHQILEINAQNVVGLDELRMRTILDECGSVVILTIMPSELFETLVSETEPRLIRKNMDHTAPAGT